MICYDCELSGTHQQASALCHHCSAALCAGHAVVLSNAITQRYPILRTVVLPLRARFFLCRTCKQALEQKTKWNPAQDYVSEFESELDVVHSAGPL